MDKYELLNILRSALVNCDNVPRLPPGTGIEIVKTQIQWAIDVIEGKEEEDRRVEHHRTSEGEAGV